MKSSRIPSTGGVSLTPFIIAPARSRKGEVTGFDFEIEYKCKYGGGTMRLRRTNRKTHRSHRRIAADPRAASAMPGGAYLATNRKKEVSFGIEFPMLPAPPVVWQLIHTALASPARSAVLHQAFSVPNVRVS